MIDNLTESDNYICINCTLQSTFLCTTPHNFHVDTKCKLKIIKEQVICVLCIYVCLGQVTSNFLNFLTYPFFKKERDYSGRKFYLGHSHSCIFCGPRHYQLYPQTIFSSMFV